MKNKESIVFLSGLLCDETVWEDISEELGSIYDISIISFKGFDSIENMAKKVLDKSPENFILIGHSMGGRVALEVYKQASSRILKLGLFNTGVHPRSEAEESGRKILLDLAKKEGISKVAKEWLPPMMSTLSLSDRKLMEKLNKMINSYSVEEFFDQIHALLERPDAQSILSTITIPTLLLSGTEDKWSPISQHQEMQKYIKISSLSIIKNANHMAPVEQPKEVADAISNWLNHS